MTRARVLVAGCMAAFAVSVASSGVASAGTYNNAWGAIDSDVTTTMNWPNGHPAFTLNLWANRNCGGSICSTTYSVWMYNSGGALVWSAGAQSNRYYSVGGNVTRVVIKRDCACAGQNHAQRS
ncbi:hypothetical protein [Nocardia alba]|uniref:Uncharacterized protein n=1 Tax=Nocardia alba TaxID=225051 RepID=A0A4R1FTG7_9NOCA|nr:hypothetical protein [Nocardia alba]TCJ96879.1 hypothetical protein DFR71_2913 [Nocardia alba]